MRKGVYEFSLKQKWFSYQRGLWHRLSHLAFDFTTFTEKLPTRWQLGALCPIASLISATETHSTCSYRVVCNENKWSQANAQNSVYLKGEKSITITRYVLLAYGAPIESVQNKTNFYHHTSHTATVDNLWSDFKNLLNLSSLNFIEQHNYMKLKHNVFPFVTWLSYREADQYF